VIPVNKKLYVTVLVFLFCLGTCFAGAEQLKAVVLKSEGDQVVINRGSEDGVQVGQTWVLGHSTKVGAVVIQEVRSHSASGRLRGEAHVGTLASLGNEADIQQFLTDEDAKTQLVASAQRDPAALKRLRRQYKDALEDSTEKRGFVTQIGGGGINMQGAQLLNLGVEAYNYSRIVSLSNDLQLTNSGFFSPWWLAASAASSIGSSIQQRNMFESQRVRVDVEVTHWDQELTDLQTEVLAAEKGWSISETLAQKVSMAKARGVDQYTVFEVVMKNVGKLPAPVGDFKYKMFLLSAEGRPISASRVDAVLDRTLQPGDEVRGMVYFPRITAAGQDRLKVAFEQMFGDRGELEFRVKD